MPKAIAPAVPAAPATVPAQSGPDDVYALMSKHMREIEGDPDFAVELVWNPSDKTVIVLIFSEKGGVGKTALTNSLAAVGAHLGLNVLVIDLDPRATATEELGVGLSPGYSVNDILYVDPNDDDPIDIRGRAADYMVPAGEAWPTSIRVLAAERALGNREFDNTDGMTTRLDAALSGNALDGIDLVLIDVPPRPGGKLVAAATRIKNAKALIPVTVDQDGWRGLEDGLLTLRKTRRAAALDPIEVIGIVRNMIDRRTPRAHVKVTNNRLATDELSADLLLRDVAVPLFGIRAESRMLEVPITAADTREARGIIAACTRILNHIGRS